jgi:hypothetical protein
MQTVKAIFGLALVVICTGCSTLTQSQLNEVNCFGQLTCNFSACPGTIVGTLNHIHQQSEIYGANSQSNSAEHTKAIKQIKDFIDTTNLYTPQIDLSLKIINEYAQGLVLLTSTKHSQLIDTAAIKLGTNLDGLITTYNKVDPNAKLPTGIGSSVAAVIALGGDVYTRSKQAEDIKQVVPLGDQIIEKVTGNLLAFLGPAKGDTTNTKTLYYLIWHERKSAIIHYQKYLEMNRDEVIKKGDSDASFYIVNKRFASITDDQNFLQMLQDIDNTEVLRGQCITAVTGLRKAHAKLLQDIKEKTTLKEYATELQAYSSEVRNAYNTIKAIK